MNDHENHGLISTPDSASPADTQVERTGVACLLAAVRDEPLVQPGEIVGGYVVRRFLGGGGQGQVFEAEQLHGLNRRVSLKLAIGLKTETDRVEFIREGQLQAKAGLHHQGILPVYSAGRDGDHVFLVLPYIRGASLRELCGVVRSAVANKAKVDVIQLMAAVADYKDRDFVRPWLLHGSSAAPPAMAAALVGPVVLPPSYFQQVARWMIEAARALHAAHSVGVLHLDVKPSNLLVELGSAQIKVADFGLGVRFAPEKGPADYVSCKKDGTVGYTAPEVLRDGTADVRSDVYSLGACLYELASLRKHTEHASSSAPRDVQAIAGKALSSDPSRRYQTAAAFADDLQRWLDRCTTVALWGPRQWPRAFGLWVRRNRAWAITGMAVLIAIAVSTFGAVAQQRAEAERQSDARKVAEREKERIALERRFEQALLGSQRIALQPPVPTGWSRIVRTRLREILEFRPDADLRDYAAETLVGLDAVHAYEYRTELAEGRWGFSYVAYDPEGKRLVASAWSQPGLQPSAAVLWDGQVANKPVESTRPGTGPVAFPDAASPLQLILPTGNQRSLTLWNVATNKVVVEIPLPGPGWIACAALSPDARLAAACFVPVPTADKKDPKAKLASPEPITLLWAIDRNPASASAKKLSEWPTISTALAFSADGKLLATGADSGQVTVYTTAGGKEILSFSEGDLAISGLAFGRNYRRPSGRRPEPIGPAAGWLLAVGSKGGGLSVWNLRTKTRLNAFYGSEHAVYGLAFSRDGTMLASAGRFSPFLWDVGTGRPLIRIGWKQRNFWSRTEGLAFTPKGDRIAYASTAEFAPNGGIDVFRLVDDRGIRSYRGLTGVVAKTWLSPTGKYVAALSQNWQLGVWDRATGEAIYVWDVPEGLFSDNSAAAFYKDDLELVFASGRHATRWSLSTGERTELWDLPRGLNDSLVTQPGRNPILIRRDPWKGPAMSIRARELGPAGKLTELYRLADLDARDVENTYQSADGRFLFVNMGSGKSPRLYNGLTGERIPLEPAMAPLVYTSGSLTSSGRVLELNERREGDYRVHLFSLPELKRITIQTLNFSSHDDAAKLCLVIDNGVALHRMGEDKPLVTFDAGRRPADNSSGISPDGRFVYWGRRDGTVCVADVSRCLEQLAPFGKR